MFAYQFVSIQFIDNEAILWFDKDVDHHQHHFQTIEFFSTTTTKMNQMDAVG